MLAAHLDLQGYWIQLFTSPEFIIPCVSVSLLRIVNESAHERERTGTAHATQPLNEAALCLRALNEFLDRRDPKYKRNLVFRFSSDDKKGGKGASARDLDGQSAGVLYEYTQRAYYSLTKSSQNVASTTRPLIRVVNVCLFLVSELLRISANGNFSSPLLERLNRR